MGKTLTPKQAAEDIMKLHDYVKENFGYEMRYFRFPSGNFNEQTLAVVQSMGYKSVFWSFAYACGHYTIAAVDLEGGKGDLGKKVGS